MSETNEAVLEVAVGDEVLLRGTVCNMSSDRVEVRFVDGLGLDHLVCEYPSDIISLVPTPREVAKVGDIITKDSLLPVEGVVVDSDGQAYNFYDHSFRDYVSGSYSPYTLIYIHEPTEEK